MRQQRHSDELRLSLARFPVAEWRFGIIHSSYYKEEMETMVSLTGKTLIDLGVSEGNIKVHAVAGSFEIPLIGAALAKKGAVDALVGLGIVVEGETHHARLIAENAARGMMDVQTAYRIPFVFEVLYVKALADAQERLGKGEDAALCAVQSLAALHVIA